MRRTGVLRASAAALVVGLTLLLVTSGSFKGASGRAEAAPPPDGVIDIAIVMVEGFDEWDAADFAALGVAPGVFPFTFTFIPVSALTPAGLAPFDVLIIAEDNEWNEFGGGLGVPPNITSAIVNWVKNGGTLIIDFVDLDGPDAFLGPAFGSSYAVTWLEEVDEDTVVIVNAANPLVSFPNLLSGDNLSNWSESIHSAMTMVGSAWRVAASGESGDALICATFGKGSIVVNGMDASDHVDDQGGVNAQRLIENMIVVAHRGFCSVGAEPTPTATPAINNSFILGAVGAAAGQQAAENRAAAARAAATPARPVAPPSTGSGPVITAPSTGDGGLESRPAPPSYAGIALVAAGFAGLALATLRRATR